MRNFVTILFIEYLSQESYYQILIPEGGYLQMGAQYINGADNPIYRIAEKLGVVAGIVDDQAHIANPTYLTGNQPIDRLDHLFKILLDLQLF